MKRKIIVSLMTVFFALFFECNFAQTKVESAHLTDRSRSGIVAYLSKLIKDSSIVVGQQCRITFSNLIEYDVYIEGLYKSTKKYPALIGLDYGLAPGVEAGLMNQYAIKYWKMGGMVALNWNANNPWGAGQRDSHFNSVANKSYIDLRKLLRNAPESKEKTNYQADLVEVGKGLIQLKKAGVTVLWRPFHEMNGAWFWWGVSDREKPTNQMDYIYLWRDMYNYFTKELKLDNLIWVYSPNANNGSTASIFVQYPGYKYVDLVGVDIYSDNPEFKEYSSFKRFNKPIVIAEVGPAIGEIQHSKFNEQKMLNGFRGKAGYFLQWSSAGAEKKFAIIDNLGFEEMMGNSHAITLDKLR